MYQHGRDIRDRPLSYRRRVLEDVVGDGHHVYAARRLHPHGLDAWGEVKQCGYEGLVAKREASPYRAGPTLEYVGRVEWGVSRRVVAELRERVRMLSTAPYKNVGRERGI